MDLVWAKFRYSRFKTRLSDSISDGFLGLYGYLEKLLVLPLLALLLVTLYLTYLELQQGNTRAVSATATTAGAIATLFLVGITIRYARQTRAMAQSIKTDQLRDKILGVLSQIDDLLDILDDQESDFAEARTTQDKWDTFPDLRQFSSPYPLAADIHTHYPPAAVVLTRYLKTSDQYHSLFMELVNELEEVITDRNPPETLPDQIQSLLPTGVKEDRLSIPWGVSDHPQIVIEEEARQIAWSVLTNHPESPGDIEGNIGRQQVAWLVFLDSRDKFMAFREDPAFEDKFLELRHLLEELENRNPRVVDVVGWVRQRLMREYRIMESELTERELSGVK